MRLTIPGSHLRTRETALTSLLGNGKPGSVRVVAEYGERGCFAGDRCTALSLDLSRQQASDIVDSFTGENDSDWDVLNVYRWLWYSAASRLPDAWRSKRCRRLHLRQ